jgi:hypothetical protein
MDLGARTGDARLSEFTKRHIPLTGYDECETAGARLFFGGFFASASSGNCWRSTPRVGLRPSLVPVEHAVSEYRL